MQIGFSRMDITPELGVELCGYGYYLERRATAILDPLYVHAVAIRDETRTVLIANCDLIGLTDSMVDTIKSAWQKELGLDRQDALLLSTHTHSGPATGVLRGCGEPDARYVHNVTQLIIDAGRRAFSKFDEVTEVSRFKTTVDGIAWNRVFRENGPLDKGVYGLVFRRKNLRPLLFVNYACHAVTLGRNSAISADYPGRVVRFLREQGYEAICLGGFSGDIDPEINEGNWGSGTEATINEYGRRIAQAAIACVDGAETMSDLTLDALEIPVEMPLQPFTEEMVREELEKAKAAENQHPAYARVIREWITAMENAAEKTETAVVQALRVGRAILVGFPGETFTELGLIIKRGLPDWHVMTLGNANYVMRYIPVSEDIEAKGYAGYGSCQIYDRLPLQRGAGEHLASVTLAAIQERWARE